MWQPLLSSIMKFAKMGLAPNRLKACRGWENLLGGWFLHWQFL